MIQLLVNAARIITDDVVVVVEITRLLTER
jgi:hypothetical protein